MDKFADVSNTPQGQFLEGGAVSGSTIGEVLIDKVHAVGADLLVMGSYTHSRQAEFVLGGATREVLAAADTPVFMHH